MFHTEKQIAGYKKQAEKRRKFTKEQEKDIVNLYVKGKGSGELAKEFSANKSTICDILHRYNITIRNNSDARRKLSLNQSIFSEITPNSAYWVGFLMADGGICNTTISLSLAITDIFHILKFKAFMGAGQKVIKSKPKTFGKYIDKGQVGISVHSSTMVDDLSTFGVVPRKSKTASVKILEFNPHFWRGVIDGDGCIGMMRKEYPTLELVGSEQLCRQFSEFVKNIFPKTKANVRFHKNIYKFGVVGKAALAVIDALYGDPNVTALDRKMERAQEILHATTP